jgi:hypothetical protein
MFVSFAETLEIEVRCMCRKHGDESQSRQRIGTSWAISAGVAPGAAKQAKDTLGKPPASTLLQSNRSLLLHQADSMFQRTEKERDVES